jgi:hypothetical protein
VGDERVETYLRLLAEAELRRAGDELRDLDAVARPAGWSDPGPAPFAVAEGAQWKVVRAGRILVAAGALGLDACRDNTQAFRLRLTPPLAAVPDTAEVVVTGPATRVRATVPIRPAPGQDLSS